MNVMQNQPPSGPIDEIWLSKLPGKFVHALAKKP